MAEHRFRVEPSIGVNGSHASEVSRSGAGKTTSACVDDISIDFATSHPPNPYLDAGAWSQLFFLWAYPLVRLGKERPLNDDDLPSLPTIDTSEYQAKHLETLMKMESQSNNPLLATALARDYWKRTRRARLLLVINMAARITQALSLGRLLRILEESRDGLELYGWAALLVVCGLVSFPTKQHQFLETYRIGLQQRTCLVASIYAKILRLPAVGSDSANEKITSGHVTNLASNDVERFVPTAVYCNFVVWGPIESFIVVGIGIYVVGPVFCVGFALYCLLLPFQFWLSRRFAHFRLQIAKDTDARASWVQQAIHGARMMKQSCFENMFLDRVTKTRQSELRKLQTTSQLKALNEAIYYMSSAVVATLVFAVHVSIGGRLTPDVVYTTLTLLSILQFTLTKHIPNAVMGLSECYVSCQRLQAFFDLPEKSHAEASSSDSNLHRDENAPLVTLANATCHWGSSIPTPSDDSSKVALSEVSADFSGGKLYCVVGKIGSGKSALIKAISGEIPVSSGSILNNARAVSYASQDPWIMDGTIRQNITMGHSFDAEWYSKVIDACALRHDLDLFPNGDGTIVGDRGVQCSGGQKARISIARAFYNREVDMVLLDEPLGAVDAKVAKTIFFSAVLGLGVRNGKCVILVTHQHQFVGMADRCVVMEHGKIAFTGTFEECKASSRNFLSSEVIKVEEEDCNDDIETTDATKHAPIQDSQQETRVTGTVRADTWKSYAKAFGGYAVCAALILIFLVTQASQLAVFTLLGEWAKADELEQNQAFWFGIVCGSTAGLIFLSVVRAQLSFFVLIRASGKLHDAMAKAVLRAKISFFDTNPLGRILNRFTADVGIADELLPLTVYDFLVGAFTFLGSVATAIVVLPVVLLVLPPLVYFFLRFRSVFVASTRELKRLEGLSRSPMYAMLSETMLGVATIRTNGYTKFFLKEFADAHNRYTRAAWSFMAASRWFATSLDILSFSLLATATFAAVLLHHQRWVEVEPALLGLALTLLIQMANTNFPWMVRQSAEVTNQMVSIERITEFSNLEPEAPLEKEFDSTLSESWPEKGDITVHDLSVRYRSTLPLALSGVSFAIEDGSRVGICGRTGSGKSTLVQSLFRLLEAEGGSILIDGVDIEKVGLHKLRKSMSIIPQVPTLFSGCTIRENLDLFGVHSDDDVHLAINEVHLKDFIDALPSDIHSMVSEGGSNFSVGQRQLLCLARATLSRNKILILDEATASVDPFTDKLIQEALQKLFAGGTILAVAHRLDTILTSDRIIVMGNARVLENDAPENLLANEAGHFAGMVRSGGHNKKHHLE